MLPSTLEKINYEHSGTASDIDILIPDKPLDFPIKGMVEEIRNEAAKACMRDISNEFEASLIYRNFCDVAHEYTDGKLMQHEVEKRYQRALEQLNELRYKEEGIIYKVTLANSMRPRAGQIHKAP